MKSNEKIEALQFFIETPNARVTEEGEQQCFF